MKAGGRSIRRGGASRERLEVSERMGRLGSQGRESEIRKAIEKEYGLPASDLSDLLAPKETTAQMSQRLMKITVEAPESASVFREHLLDAQFDSRDFAAKQYFKIDKIVKKATAPHVRNPTEKGAIEEGALGRWNEILKSHANLVCAVDARRVGANEWPRTLIDENVVSFYADDSALLTHEGWEFGPWQAFSQLTKEEQNNWEAFLFSDLGELSPAKLKENGKADLRVGSPPPRKSRGARKPRINYLVRHCDPNGDGGTPDWQEACEP